MSASTHEAVLGGARWRLTLHPDGRWDVARQWRANPKTGYQASWDDLFSGNGGWEGVRSASFDIRGRPEWFAEAGADVLLALADVAERSTT